jgi:hypothetical protein
MQGLKPDWLLRQMMTRIDENVELEDAFDVKLPSVVAQNAITTGAAKQVQPGTGKPNDPAAQGPQGAENEPAAEGGRAGIDPSRPGPRPDFPVLGAPEPV